MKCSHAAFLVVVVLVLVGAFVAVRYASIAPDSHLVPPVVIHPEAAPTPAPPSATQP